MLIKLYKNNLFYKLNKCEFNIKEVEFLSFLIKIKSVRTNFKRIRNALDGIGQYANRCIFDSRTYKKFFGYKIGGHNIVQM